MGGGGISRSASSRQEALADTSRQKYTTLVERLAQVS
jgi:hypothetical protein